MNNVRLLLSRLQDCEQRRKEGRVGETWGLRHEGVDKMKRTIKKRGRKGEEREGEPKGGLRRPSAADRPINLRGRCLRKKCRGRQRGSDVHLGEGRGEGGSLALEETGEEKGTTTAKKGKAGVKRLMAGEKERRKIGTSRPGRRRSSPFVRTRGKRKRG